MIISTGMLITAVALILFVGSSIHDYTHKDSYYYKGGTYLSAKTTGVKNEVL